MAGEADGRWDADRAGEGVSAPPVMKGSTVLIGVTLVLVGWLIVVALIVTYA